MVAEPAATDPRHRQAATHSAVSQDQPSSGSKVSGRCAVPRENNVRTNYRTLGQSGRQNPAAADDVASGILRVLVPRRVRNQTTECKDDHEEETLQSDDETMKKVTINEASTLVNTIAGLKAPPE